MRAFSFNIMGSVLVVFIDLEADMTLNDAFFHVPLLDFYKHHLPKKKFPGLYNNDLFMASLFGSTYVCEQFFSKMKLAKNQLRTSITDDNLESTLRIASTNIEPDFDELTNTKQPHNSH